MSVKVELIANGRQATLSEAVARLLVKMGKARVVDEAPVMGDLTYQTRRMSASDAPPPSEVDALRAEADRRGLKYHPRAGVAKLREVLAG
jgi:hypothetical protein